MKPIDYLSSAINEQPTLLCKFNKLMELLTKGNYFAPMKQYFVDVRRLSLQLSDNTNILIANFQFFTDTEVNLDNLLEVLKEEYCGTTGRTLTVQYESGNYYFAILQDYRIGGHHFRCYINDISVTENISSLDSTEIYITDMFTGEKRYVAL